MYYKYIFWLTIIDSGLSFLGFFLQVLASCFIFAHALCRSGVELGILVWEGQIREKILGGLKFKIFYL
jgi:hypothetical protein